MCSVSEQKCLFIDFSKVYPRFQQTSDSLEAKREILCDESDVTLRLRAPCTFFCLWNHCCPSKSILSKQQPKNRHTQERRYLRILVVFMVASTKKLASVPPPPKMMTLRGEMERAVCLYLFSAEPFAWGAVQHPPPSFSEEVSNSSAPARRQVWVSWPQLCPQFLTYSWVFQKDNSNKSIIFYVILLRDAEYSTF